MKEKFRDIVNYYNLDHHEISEIAASICLADKMYGDNPKKLSFDRLLATDSANFSPLVNHEGTVKALPEVQYMRVLCDTLLIALRGSFSEPLCNKESYRVAEAVGTDLKPGGYADIDVCRGIIDKIYSSVIDTSGDWEQLKELENQLNKYKSLFDMAGIFERIHHDSKDIAVPIKLEFIGKEGIPADTFKNTYNKLLGIAGVALLDSFIHELNKLCRSKEGSVHANLISYRFSKNNPHKIGTGNYYYMSNAGNIPMFVNEKLNKVFEQNSNWNKDSIHDLILLNFYLRNRKNSFMYEDAVKAMKGVE